MHSKLYCIDSKQDIVTDSFDIPVPNFHLDGNKLYICGKEFSYTTNITTGIYAILDVASKQILTKNFITDGTDLQIKEPYGIAVNPITKDIYVTDVSGHTTPGTLYCFDNNGKKK